MPTAKKLPSGSWRCQITSHWEYKDGKKKPVRLSFTCEDPGPEGKKEAERLAAEYLYLHKDRAQAVTVHDAIERYIKIKGAVLSPSTVTAYRSYLNSGCYKSIEVLDVRRIRRADVQMWVSMFAAEHSAKYTKNVYRLLAPALEMCGVPEMKITLPKGKKKEIYTPSDSEILQLLQHIENNYELKIAVMLAAFGSMRRSEICALTIYDITGNQIRVNKAMVREREGQGGQWVIKETAKTEDSTRIVTVPAFVTKMIRKDRVRVVDLNPDALSNRFNRAVRFSGCSKRFTFHSLRHYYVSIGHVLNISDAYIMKMGGWRTDHVMKDHYRATLSDYEKRERDKLLAHFESVNAQMHTKMHTKAI